MRESKTLQTLVAGDKAYVVTTRYRHNGTNGKAEVTIDAVSEKTIYVRVEGKPCPHHDETDTATLLFDRDTGKIAGCMGPAYQLLHIEVKEYHTVLCPDEEVAVQIVQDTNKRRRFAEGIHHLDGEQLDKLSIDKIEAIAALLHIDLTSNNKR
jgi:hypothetical protein